MTYKFAKIFDLSVPDMFLQHQYKSWRDGVGLQLFDILLEQKYPCIIDITETERERYAFGNSSVIEQQVTIEIDVKAVDIQRGQPYSMHRMESPTWMEYEKKSFWDKLRFWKR